MATLNNFTITSPQNQDVLIYSNGSWINSNFNAFFGVLDGRYATNTHNHDTVYMLKGEGYSKSETYPAASLYTKTEIDALVAGAGGGGGSGGGLVNSASNVGTGAGVFHANASGDLQFRSLYSSDIDLLSIEVSGSSILLTPSTPTWSRLVSDNGQLTTSHVNFANQGVNTSSKPTFAGLTVDTGSWSSTGFKLTGTAPSIYFSQNDGKNAFVGINGTTFYVLQDSDSNGDFESPYTIQANMDGSDFRYYGKKVYHEGHKPSISELGGTIDLSQLPSRIADFNDGVLNNTYVFNNTVGLGDVSYLTFKDDNSSGSVTVAKHSDDFIRWRFGTTADLQGISLSRYDTTNITLSADGWATFNGGVAANRVSAGYDSGIEASISCSNWFRSSGDTGWFSATHGGGIHMKDSSWLRVYNGRKFLVSSGENDSIKTYGGVSAASLDCGYIKVNDEHGFEIDGSRAGGWARGLVASNGSTTVYGAAGLLGGENYVTRFAVGFNNNTWWNNYQFAVSATSMDVTVTSNLAKTIVTGSSTIAGSNFNNGWLQIGNSTEGWAIDPNEIYSAGTGIIGTLSGDLQLRPLGQVDVKGSKLSNGGANTLRVTSAHGYVDIGSKNSSWAHFYTDRPKFYFDQEVHVKNHIQIYNQHSRLEPHSLYLGATSADYARLTSGGNIAKRASWANNSAEREVLKYAWSSHIGDYALLHATGNSTTNGAMLMGGSVFAVGQNNYSGVAAASSVDVFSNATWMAVTNDRLYFQKKLAFKFSDAWLRINESKEFTSGIYCGGSTLRTDGALQVGSGGNAFNANTGQIDLKVTTRVHGVMHTKEIRSQDGNFTTIGAGELGNSLYSHVASTHGTGNEGLHIGGENGVYVYSHPNNMTGGLNAGYSIRVLAPDGASYLNHLDVYKNQNNASQLVARFRHPNQNANVAIVSKNNSNGSFRLEANMDDQDLRIQTADTNGNFYASGASVGTIARFHRNGNVTIAGEMSTADTKARSDIRVKKDLVPIDRALEKVCSLTGYTYTETIRDKRMASIVAQEVEKVLPESIGKDASGMLNVSPMGLIGLLVNAVKEQEAKYNELLNVVQDLASKMEVLSDG